MPLHGRFQLLDLAYRGEMRHKIIAREELKLPKALPLADDAQRIALLHLPDCVDDAARLESRSTAL